MFPISFNFPFRKKDGSLTTMDDAISSGGGSYTLPTASAETKGGVKIGSGLSMSGETLNNSNPTPYTLPTASAETKGGVKIGSGLEIDENGVLSTSGGGGSSVTYSDVAINKQIAAGGRTYHEITVPSGKVPISVAYMSSEEGSSYNTYFNTSLQYGTFFGNLEWIIVIHSLETTGTVNLKGNMRVYFTDAI